jgi:hypothetical protein
MLIYAMNACIAIIFIAKITKAKETIFKRSTSTKKNNNVENILQKITDLLILAVYLALL